MKFVLCYIILYSQYLQSKERANTLAVSACVNRLKVLIVKSCVLNRKTISMYTQERAAISSRLRLTQTQSAAFLLIAMFFLSLPIRALSALICVE